LNHVNHISVKVNVKKEEKQITTDIVRSAESINHALERSILIRRNRHLKKSERTRGIRMIDGATREDIVRWNRYQCEKEKRKKYRRKQKIFTYGFYIGMILWMCGLVASMIVDNAIMKILLIFIPLAIYQFFTIGKGIIEDKIKRGRY